MIRSVKIAPGLGNPPARYYTSNNKSLNNRLKLEQNHEKLLWPKFNITLEGFCRYPMTEATLAITGRGNCDLAPEYRHFFVSLQDWNLKSDFQRSHIKRFLNATPKENCCYDAYLPKLRFL